MKKFWEKHDLVKVSGIMVLLTVVLTWIIPQGYFSGTSLSAGEITRVGIFDFFTYGLLGMYYFTVLVTFLFVMGGFYEVLNKCGGYRKLTDSIAKKFKGKDILFVLVVSFIIAAISAITNEYILLVAVIPFFITIMRKMGMDKLTGFLATFGAVLVGVLGSVYSTKIVGQNVAVLGSTYDSYLWVKLVLFFVSYAVFNLFTILHMKKQGKKVDLLVDNDTTEYVSKKTKVWPVLTILIIFAVVSLLAYLPWVDAWGVNIFSDAQTAVMDCKVFGVNLFSFILGQVGAFGSWDIFGIQVLMLLSTLLIKWIYHIDFNEYLSAFGEGFKKFGKLVVILLICYVTLEFAVMYPVIPTIVNWIMGLSKEFNVFLGFISGLFTSLFTVEYQYTLNLIGSYFVSAFESVKEQIPVLLQSTYGLASLFTPTSAILLIGLAYCGISYKDWMKHIWKFLLIMLVVVLVLMLIIF